MKARIINRGRGPEIEGTRVTVFRVLDFLRDGCDADHIAAELDLSGEQIQAALEYVAAHTSEVDAEYSRILERVQRSNPEAVRAGAVSSTEGLKQRIQAKLQTDTVHADSTRQ